LPSNVVLQPTAPGFARWRRAITGPWLTNASLLLLGFGLLLLTRQLISEFDHYTLGFSGVSGWSLILFGISVMVVLTRPSNRWTFRIIVTASILYYLVVLLPDPYLSSDVYRYAWDGVVQHAHISPYRYVPGDPVLSFLRAPNQDLFDNINRRDYAHTIYPPGAQLLFFLVTFINPSVTGMKLAMISLSGLTMVGLLLLFKQMGIRREQILLYSWCPLLVWEIGSSGHLDAAAMAFIVFALLARLRLQPGRTGLFLAMAVLIKLYPIVLFPALYRKGKSRMPVVLLAVIAVSYACYASVGLRVFGFLGGYVQEEGMASGDRYFLLDLVQHIRGLSAIPVWAYMVFCGVIATAILLWCWRACSTAQPVANANIRRHFYLPEGAEFIAPAALLSFVMMLLFSPHYPWYVAWLIPFFAIIPSFSLFAYTGGVFYLFTTALAVGSGPKEFLMNEILYSAVGAAFLLELCAHRWPVHRRLLLDKSGAISQDFFAAKQVESKP
jgi:alpha-1,6-mannosyltransferase